MNNLFVVVLKYIAPLEEIDACRPKHLQFLDRYYDEGIFIASGRQVPIKGGIILAKCSSKIDLEQIMEQDPFLVEKLAECQIYEFTATKSSDLFKKMLEEN